MTSLSTLPAVRLAALAAVAGLEHGFERRPERPRSETRAETRSRVGAALAPCGELLLLEQVHGAQVQAGPWTGRPEADAATVDRPGYLIGIETADCLPVLLIDPERRLAAAAHAGWRGTAAGIAAHAARALIALGAAPDRLLAAIGPGIGACCYEVGPELRAAFGDDAPAVFRRDPNGRDRLDLREANRRQLEAAGLSAARIHHVAECTACHPALYPSYRRDGPEAGRMLSWVGFRADDP